MPASEPEILPLPQFLSEETRQIARVLAAPECVADVRAVLDGDKYFEAAECGRAWLAILRVHDKGQAVTSDTVRAVLRESDDSQALLVLNDAAEQAAAMKGAGIAKSALRNARGMAAALEARERENLPASSERSSPEPELPPLPPCPWQCLPGRLGEFGRAVGRNMESSESLVLGAMLAALSASVPATFKIAGRAGFVEIAPLWIAVCAHPGSKKSPTIGRILEPLGDYDAGLHCAYGLAHQSWRETCAALPKKTATPPEPQRAQVLLDDATVEALSDTLNANQRHGITTLAAPDELKALFGSFDQYRARGKGADRQRWLSLWAGQPWRQNRKGRFVFIRSPRVAVIGGIQPNIAATLQTLDESDGLLERLHWIDGRDEREPSFDVPPVPNDLELAWASTLRALLPVLQPCDLHPPAPGETAPEADSALFRLSSEAREHFKSFYEVLDRRALSGWQRGYIGKLAGQCLRLALTLHCAEHGREVFKLPEVSGPTMQAAITLTQWLSAHTVRLRCDLSGRAAESDLDRARSWIERKGGSVTLRELSRSGLPGIESAADAERVGNDFVRAGLAAWQAAPGSGPESKKLILKGRP